MTEKNSMLVRAAMAGLVGAALIAAPAQAAKKAKKNMQEVVKCYGVNSCSGKGKCGGPGAGHECAGKNSCAGQGWLFMPQDSCLSIKGGSLTPPATKPDEKPAQ